MAVIDKIILTPKGNYDSSIIYQKLDIVRYDGKSWICKKNMTVGVVPSEGENWSMLVQDGIVDGNVGWSSITDKPFNSVSNTDFKVVNNELQFNGNINPTWSSITGKPNFATVATSGSFKDLTDKPLELKYSKVTLKLQNTFTIGAFQTKRIGFSDCTLSDVDVYFREQSVEVFTETYPIVVNNILGNLGNNPRLIFVSNGTSDFGYYSPNTKAFQIYNASDTSITVYGNTYFDFEFYYRRN